jgi:hypothetical protein
MFLTGPCNLFAGLVSAAACLSIARVRVLVEGGLLVTETALRLTGRQSEGLMLVVMCSQDLVAGDASIQQPTGTRPNAPGHTFRA